MAAQGCRNVPLHPFPVFYLSRRRGSRRRDCRNRQSANPSRPSIIAQLTVVDGSNSIAPISLTARRIIDKSRIYERRVDGEMSCLFIFPSTHITLYASPPRSPDSSPLTHPHSSLLTSSLLFPPLRLLYRRLNQRIISFSSSIQTKIKALKPIHTISSVRVM